MASNIAPANIDATFPKAGQDNSSQGFRDNFNAVKNSLTDAKTEIEDLQTNKANLNAASDFTDNILSRAELKDTSQTVYAHGTTGGAITLNHENGHYQTITTNAAVTLSFTNWPTTGKVGRIVLDIVYALPAHTITIPSAVLVSGGVGGGDGSSDTITCPTTGPSHRYLYEFLTPDGGTTILMNQLGNNYI